MAIKDLTGQRFGRLTVISFAGVNKQRNSTWLCRCDCGNERIVRASDLRSGHTTSCGCYQKQRCCECHTTHGGRHTRLYRIWREMIRRCRNANRENYTRYGGRGIKVCDEWLNSFEAFRDWALANGYRDDLSIERKNNNKGYYPENCRWATPKEQSNNKRNNLVYTIKGKTQTLKQHVEDPEINIHDLGYETARKRLKRGGTPEEVFSTPPRGKHNIAEAI